MNTAEEQIQTGFFTASVDHLYEKITSWKRLFGWGMFESLLGKSTYEFGIEYREETFDFSVSSVQPDGVDEDGLLTVKCGYPTQHPDSALYLYQAAMNTVMMVSVQPRIMHEDRANGQGVMEAEQVEAAQLTAPPSEFDESPQEFETLETWGEHHLNLPLSRLISDQSDLLEMGGVSADPESDSDDVDADDIVLSIDADADGVETEDDTGTDPNQFGDDLTSQSEKILDSASE